MHLSNSALCGVTCADACHHQVLAAAGELTWAKSHAQVTTNPFPLRADMHRQNTDWRTDPIILLYNAVAQDVMQAAGIETVSTWNLAAPLADLSYDRGHYKGVVGYYISLFLLNIVCR